MAPGALDERTHLHFFFFLIVFVARTDSLQVRFLVIIQEFVVIELYHARPFKQLLFPILYIMLLELMVFFNRGENLLVISQQLMLWLPMLRGGLRRGILACLVDAVHAARGHMVKLNI